MVVHRLSALDTLGFTQLQFSFSNGMWLDAMEFHYQFHFNIVEYN